MQKNTVSLFNGNWMFAENGQNVLMPHLLQILKGNNLKDVSSLNSTEVLFNSISNNFASNNQKLGNQNQIAVISMHHPIFKYDQMCGPKGTQSVMNLMEEWKNDNDIIGVVFDVNSPGGQASGNSEFAHYINSYPKPTVTFTKDIVGSAAYYFASATDYIIASEFADFIGSVGTMYYSVNMEGVIRKSGATINELYSDLSPEKNAQSRALKEGDAKPLINKFLNPSAEQFHADVLSFRPNITSLALKGDIFSPKEALEQGLIDSLGTMQDAFNKIIELSDSQQKPTNNLNTMNTTERTNVQAVLGLDAPLASTENGSYLNDEQLDAMESHLADSATALATAESATQDAQDALAQEQQTVTDLGTSLNALAVSAGIEAQATTAETITALQNRIAELSQEPSATHTTVVKKQNNNEAIPEYVDLECSIYTAHKN